MFYIKSTNAETNSSYKCVNLYVINKLQNDHGTIKELSDDHSIVNKMSILFSEFSESNCTIDSPFFHEYRKYEKDFKTRFINLTLLDSSLKK